MAITLDGNTLSGSLQWLEKDAWSPVAQTTQYTLGGGLVVYTQQLLAGRPITLEATEDTGWITRTMLDQIEALAAVPGAVYTLVVHGYSANVIFRHDEPPAVEFTPLQPRATPQPTDYYIGRLKLLTV
jgi:hypothetical protein